MEKIRKQKIRDTNDGRENEEQEKNWMGEINISELEEANNHGKQELLLSDWEKNIILPIFKEGDHTDGDNS